MSIDLTKVTLAEFFELKAMMGDITTPPETQEAIQAPTPKANYIPVLESWQEDLRSNDLSKGTRDLYEQHVNAFFDWHSNDDLNSVKDINIIDYRDYLHNKMGLRPATINLKRVALNRFFQFCVDSEILKLNPVRKVKKVQEQKLPPTTPTESEVNRMRSFIELNCNSRKDYNQLMIFDFMKTLGMRVSEVTNLRFNDINVDKQTLTVKHGKGNKVREIPMTQELMKSYKRFASNLNRSNIKHQFIFMYRGKPYEQSAIRSFYNRIRKLAGIKTSLSPHSLRHFFCKSHVDKGMALTKIATICGHSTVDVTAKYAEPNTDDLREALEQ